MQISKTWVDDNHTTASSSSSFLKFSSIKRRIHSPIPFVYLFTFCHLPACEFPSTLSGFSLHFLVFLLSSLFCWLFFSCLAMNIFIFSCDHFSDSSDCDCSLLRLLRYPGNCEQNFRLLTAFLPRRSHV